jgi:hypothetical protein
MDGIVQLSLKILDSELDAVPKSTSKESLSLFRAKVNRKSSEGLCFNFVISEDACSGKMAMQRRLH